MVKRLFLGLLTALMFCAGILSFDKPSYAAYDDKGAVVIQDQYGGTNGLLSCVIDSKVTKTVLVNIDLERNPNVDVRFKRVGGVIQFGTMYSPNQFNTVFIPNVAFPRENIATSKLVSRAFTKDRRGFHLSYISPPNVAMVNTPGLSVQLKNGRVFYLDMGYAGWLSAKLIDSGTFEPPSVECVKMDSPDYHKLLITKSSEIDTFPAANMMRQTLQLLANLPTPGEPAFYVGIYTWIAAIFKTLLVMFGLSSS